MMRSIHCMTDYVLINVDSGSGIGGTGIGRLSALTCQPAI
jgi:hypothetical protein